MLRHILIIWYDAQFPADWRGSLAICLASLSSPSLAANSGLNGNNNLLFGTCATGKSFPRGSETDDHATESRALGALGASVKDVLAVQAVAR